MKQKLSKITLFSAVTVIISTLPTQAFAYVDVGNGTSSRSSSSGGSNRPRVVSPDAADRSYEAAVSNGQSSYVNPYTGRSQRITQQDVHNVSVRRAARDSTFKHVSTGISNTEQTAIQQQQRIAQQAKQEKKKIQADRAKYKKDVKDEVNKVNEQRKKQANDSKRKQQKYRKQLAKLNKKKKMLLQAQGINEDGGRQRFIRYTDALGTTQYTPYNIKYLQDIIKSVKNGDEKVIRRELRGLGYTSNNIPEQDKAKKLIVETLESQISKEEQELKEAKDIVASNKSTVDNYYKTNEKLYKEMDKIEQDYQRISKQLAQEKQSTRKLSPSQRTQLKKLVIASVDKPQSLRRSTGNAPGQKAGTGSAAASSTKAPDGKVPAVSYANVSNRKSNHQEGDISVFTYIDLPGNQDKTDQRIGNVKVKVEKIEGEEDCDPHKEDVVKTIPLRYKVNKKTGKKKFVHGTANFKNCAPGKYKVTYIGRDGYKLRDGEDAVQTVTVKDNHTTEAIFTVVKK